MAAFDSFIDPVDLARQPVDYAEVIAHKLLGEPIRCIRDVYLALKDEQPLTVTKTARGYDLHTGRMILRITTPTDGTQMRKVYATLMRQRRIDSWETAIEALMHDT